MKIKYTPLDFPTIKESNLGFDFVCEICGRDAQGFLTFTGFNEQVYVCINHIESMKVNNPPLIPFLQLLYYLQLMENNIIFLLTRIILFATNGK